MFNLIPNNVVFKVRCAENCTSKFLKASERMTQRFQEYQLIMNEHVITAQQNANA